MVLGVLKNPPEKIHNFSNPTLKFLVAIVQKYLQIQPFSIYFLGEGEGSMPPDPPSLAHNIYSTSHA